MRHLAALGAVGVALALAGCGSDEEPPPQAAPPGSVVVPEPEPDPAPGCTPGVRPLRSDVTAYAAIVTRPTVARRAPGGPAIERFARINVNGVPTVLGVLGVRRDPTCAPTWYRVQLPIRPNGAVGWVRATDVRLRRVTTRIDVDLSARRVALYRDGRKVIETVAAIGKPGTPTPMGRYYVNQRLVAPDPSGPFGPAAVGISAFSPTLQGWTQGGPIAIHGTNVPRLLGEAVSYGCVRIANAVLRELYEQAEEGTPVVIRA